LRQFDPLLRSFLFLLSFCSRRSLLVKKAMDWPGMQAIYPAFWLGWLA